MSAEQIEAMCEAARQRIAQHVNRVAGQHLRAIRASFAGEKPIRRVYLLRGYITRSAA